MKQKNVTQASGKEVRVKAENKTESDEEELIQKDNLPKTKAKDTSEVGISPDTLIFSTDDWEGIKKVYVKGKDDNKADKDRIIEIISKPAISVDEAYNNFDTPNPQVHNLNDDEPGVWISPICCLNVSEDGDTLAFNLGLLSEPKANVSIGLSIDDPSEATLKQD